MKYLSIKKFDEVQHYKRKDWSPPWIKLYNRLLDDYEFLRLSEIAQRHLICLWLLASRHSNRIPNDLSYITTAIKAKSVVDLDELIIAGFVIPTDEPPIRKTKRRKKKTPVVDSRIILEESYKESTPEKRRVEKSRVEKKTSSPRGGWTAEGSDWVSEHVCEMSPGQFGARFKALVDRWTWPRVFAGLKAWCEATVGKNRRINWFLDNPVHWIEISQESAIDPETGLLRQHAKVALGIA